MSIKNLTELSQDALKEFKKSAQSPISGDELKKAGVTVASNFTAYDLQAPAKNLFPVLTPLRNDIPRVMGGGGSATNWKKVIGINTAHLRGFVPEGSRNGVVTTNAVDASASYKALGMEDSITFEAELAAKGFEDIRSTQAQRLLWATMIEEELADLGSNLSVALGTPTAPTLVVATTGGSIADGTYNVIVVALTLMGYQAASLTAGLPGTVSVTPAAGSAFTYGGGNSNKSSATSTGAISGSGANKISASVPVVTGAVAYAWFAGTAGSEKLQAITTINSVVLTSLLTTTQAASAISADSSQNALGYDGLLYHAWGASSGAYIQNMANGSAGVGTGLTFDGVGGIVEINDLFRSMWDNLRLSPTVIYVNAQEMDNITKKVVNKDTAARISFASGSDMSGGLRIASLINRFAMNGSIDVPLQIHPNMPAGTLMAFTKELPYPINGVPNVCEMRLRRDYYQMEWPLQTRKYESGVYFDGVLAHYFTPSLGIITNIGNA